MSDRICSFVECDKRAKAFGLCHSHADQRRRGRDLAPLGPYAPRGQASLQESCLLNFCDRLATKRGLCAAHYAATRRSAALNPLDVTAEQKFFRLIEARDDCWQWAGHLNRDGYGLFFFRGVQFAHRWVYEFLRADIPPELTIDHLCRNRACVNPWHLEPVTRRVNTLRGVAPSAQNQRKTVCKHGHEFTPENTIWRSTGGRRCRACMNVYNSKVAARKKGGDR